MDYSFVKSWAKFPETHPEPGILCVVTFPMGLNTVTDQCEGPTAMAYYREPAGWVYADAPTPIGFEPCYWHPLETIIQHNPQTG